MKSLVVLCFLFVLVSAKFTLKPELAKAHSLSVAFGALMEKLADEN